MKIRLPRFYRKLCKNINLLGSFSAKNECIYTQIWNLPAFEKRKNSQLMTVSMDTVRMTKSRPKKNQSERWDLPQAYLAI